MAQKTKDSCAVFGAIANYSVHIWLILLYPKRYFE